AVSSWLDRFKSREPRLLSWCNPERSLAVPRRPGRAVGARGAFVAPRAPSSVGSLLDLAFKEQTRMAPLDEEGPAKDGPSGTPSAARRTPLAPGPTEVTLDLLQALPKSDLHCHLDGSLRLATILDLAQKQKVKL